MRKFGEQPLFISEIEVRNFLSFGVEKRRLELKNLNILIGPNGSGKSNLIEAIEVLRNSPNDIKRPVNESGGLSEWTHKLNFVRIARLTIRFISHLKTCPSIQHEAKISGRDGNHIAISETITGELAGNTPTDESDFYWNGRDEWHYLYDDDTDDSIATIRSADNKTGLISIDGALSVLSQRGDPDLYPVLAFLIESYRQIAIYREWHFGKNSIYRSPQRADQRNDRLEEDFSNLALVLNRFKRNVELKKRIIELLHKLNETFDDFDVSVEGGTAQIFFTEGSFTIPATRLSDGTLRFLCLIAILLDPNPPKLICLEEPELGLHPDIIPVIADMLIEASKRTQLIVTTHSDILVDCMSDIPSAIVVCEKKDGQTELRRLTEEEVAPWLEKYRLGELWTKGEIGGNRW